MRGEEAWKQMTKRIEVSPAPAPLEEYIQHFDPFFGREQSTRRFSAVSGGVIVAKAERHKRLSGLVNTEPVVGAHLPRAQKLQGFLSESDWDERQVQAQRLRLLREDATTAPNAEASVGHR
jgi:hypothetical protein